MVYERSQHPELDIGISEKIANGSEQTERINSEITENTLLAGSFSKKFTRQLSPKSTPLVSFRKDHPLGL